VVILHPGAASPLFDDRDSPSALAAIGGTLVPSGSTSSEDDEDGGATALVGGAFANLQFGSGLDLGGPAKTTAEQEEEEEQQSPSQS
jgi:hypothetical protein